MNQRLRLWTRTLGIMGLIALFSIAVAQDNWTTFVTQDGEFRFQYPAGWRVSEDVTIGLSGRDANLVIFSPNTLDRARILDDRLEDVTDNIIEFSAANFTYQEDEIEEVELESGREALRVEIDGVIAEGNEGLEFEAGFLLVTEVEDTFAAILSVSFRTVNDRELSEIVYTLADSFEVGEFDQPSEGGEKGDSDTPNPNVGDLPTLRDYGKTRQNTADWEAVIAELQNFDLIPSDGELLYTEELINTAFNGEYSEDNAVESSSADVVMGAVMSFRPPDEENVCGFIARSAFDRRGRVEAALFVGVNAENEVIVSETGPDLDDPNMIAVESPVDFYSPNHLMFIAYDQTVSVWVNGAPLIADFELIQENADFDEVFVGTDLQMSCVMSAVFAYAIED